METIELSSEVRGKLVWIEDGATLELCTEGIGRIDGIDGSWDSLTDAMEPCREDTGKPESIEPEFNTPEELCGIDSGKLG